jgi:hypothetical protein
MNKNEKEIISSFVSDLRAASEEASFAVPGAMCSKRDDNVHSVILAVKLDEIVAKMLESLAAEDSKGRKYKD